MLKMLEVLFSGILLVFSDQLLLMEGRPRRFFKVRFVLALLTYFLLVLAATLLLVVCLFLGYHGLVEQNRELLLVVAFVGLVIGLGLPWIWGVTKHMLALVKSVRKEEWWHDDSH